MTPEEAREVLAPKRTYTQAEHDLAYLRYQVSTFHWDMFRWLEHDTPEVAKEKITNVMYPEEGPDGDEYEYFWLEHRSSPFPRASFAEIAEGGRHGGDCTGMPWTCYRCYVDVFYKVNTKSWSGKAEGSKLIMKSIEDIKNEV